MLALYAVTLFFSAALLFVVEPLWARELLPWFGGSPAVWTTSILFFQVLLLAGYAAAHGAAIWMPPLRRAELWLGLLCLPLLVLPMAVPTAVASQAAVWPTLALLGCLGLGVGAPFLALATLAPSLQRWLAESGHGAGRDPYILYAASNAGSLIGLLAYPLAIEPFIGLSMQVRAWHLGYLAIIGLVAACALWLPRAQRLVATGPAAGVGAEPPPTVAARLHWVVLGAVPSGLMIASTTYLSNAVAAVPLLWVLPLALYLLTFVLVFQRRPVAAAVWERVSAVLLPAMVLVLAIDANHPIMVLIPLHLGGLFALVGLSHARLAALRPAPRHLTSFYLWQSAGGILGGTFAAIVAPVVFGSLAEYPLLLSGTAIVGMGGLGVDQWKAKHVLLLPALLGGVTIALLVALSHLGLEATPGPATLVLALAALAVWGLSRRGVAFGLAAGALLVAAAVAHDDSAQAHTVVAERSFFGVHRVTRDSGSGFLQLFHGVTLHGRQGLAGLDGCTPLLYYHRTGPIGQVFEALGPGFRAPVAAVGMGSASLGCYGRHGQSWTWYEIDPAIPRLAGTASGFTYLAHAPAAWRTVLGDARLSLATAAKGSFGLLVLDAYSSDLIPVHLLTREALALYLDKLSPDGLLAFHISNRYFDLEPVLGRLAADAGLLALVQDNGVIGHSEQLEGKTESKWLVMAVHPADLHGLGQDPRWHAAIASPEPPWTDDRASAVRAFAW